MRRLHVSTDLQNEEDRSFFTSSPETHFSIVISINNVSEKQHFITFKSNSEVKVINTVFLKIRGRLSFATTDMFIVI